MPKKIRIFKVILFVFLLSFFTLNILLVSSYYKLQGNGTALFLLSLVILVTVALPSYLAGRNKVFDR